MRSLYNMVILCCLVTGLLLCFNLVVSIMYYQFYLG